MATARSGHACIRFSACPRKAVGMAPLLTGAFAVQASIERRRASTPLRSHAERGYEGPICGQLAPQLGWMVWMPFAMLTIRWPILSVLRR